MKLTTQPAETEFKPVSFTIACETQKELDFWAAVMDSIPFSRIASKMGANFQEIKSNSFRQGDTVHLTNEFHKLLNEAEF
jgi:predicted 3-demethylubiquinone-9 3-methyltransferase (glyoxalase superfamily)